MKARQGSFCQKAAMVGLAFYKQAVSPFLHAVGGKGGACRFGPTCSEYAVLAWHLHGPVHGTILAGWRLARCHPFARGGFDPVPDVLPRWRRRKNNPPAAI